MWTQRDQRTQIDCYSLNMKCLFQACVFEYSALSLLVVFWSLTGEVGVDLEISRQALFPVLCPFLVHGDMSKHCQAPACVPSFQWWTLASKHEGIARVLNYYYYVCVCMLSICGYVHTTVYIWKSERLFCLSLASAGFTDEHRYICLRLGFKKCHCLSESWHIVC